MPSTFLSLNDHVVFSTKDRQPLIREEWISRLHEYLGGTIRGLDGTSLAIGGTADHVHLLFRLRATHRLSDFMRELKKQATVWIHEELGEPTFSWQEGYGAFTVSPNAIDDVRGYVLNQEEHHRKKSFRDEFVEFLDRAGIEFEDRYLD